MAQYEFHEMGEFHVVTHAVKKADDCWAAFVFFDRKADRSKPLAPALRLHIPVDFKSEADALTGAAGWAAQSIGQGDINL